jgi:hypothetical protein
MRQPEHSIMGESMATKRKPNPAKDESRVLILRTCKPDGTSHNGFRWTLEVGAEVSCSDWSPKPECGNGLHGLLWGRGDWSLLSRAHDAVYLVVSAPKASVVKIDGGAKVKVPACRVEFVGHGLAPGMADAVAYITAREPTNKSKGSASGDSASLSASGDDARLSASGYYASLSASGESASLSASGHHASLSASGYCANLSASGKRSIVATLRPFGLAMAGPDGCIILAYNDGQRPRVCVGYVGEGGIEAGVWYQVNAKRELEAVK